MITFAEAVFNKKIKKKEAAPELPYELAHVWFWFQDLGATRGHSPSGLLPITYAEIDAYARRMRLTITPFEVALIRQLDDVALHSMRPKTGTPGLSNEVSVEDGAAVAAFMRRMGKKKPRPASARPGKPGSAPRPPARPPSAAGSA